MDGHDLKTEEVRPEWSARLQATMPHARARTAETPGTSVPEARLPSPRVHQTAFRQATMPAVANQPPRGIPLSDPLRGAEPYGQKAEPSGFRLVMEAFYAQRWLIAGLIAAGLLAAYFYSTRICVPLYRVQASLEIQNNREDSMTETLAHVLQSQSMVQSAMSALPEAEQESLVEKQGWLHTGPSAPVEKLRSRVSAVPMASAQVIDLDVVVANRRAGVHFVNALIDGLMRRNEEEKRSASVVLPDEPTHARVEAAEKITIIDPAIPLTDPVAPVLAVNLLAGFLVGLLTGVTIALVRKFAASTFSEPGTVGKVLGMRELGAIPERKLLTAGGADSELEAMQLGVNDESLRYLRSSLLYQPGRQEVRSIAFTSAAPGEGKTSAVASLAMSLAATGRRVLAIDGDLRRPRLHKLFQTAQGPGLADLLRRDPHGPAAALAKFVAATAYRNLYVLPPGSAGGDDALELLAGPMLARLLQDLGRVFDYVLIDTPPLLACADARNFGRAAEGVVLVVRSSETQKRAALVARDMLRQDGANIIGTVVTGSRPTHPAYGYPGGSNYARLSVSF